MHVSNFFLDKVLICLWRCIIEILSLWWRRSRTLCCLKFSSSSFLVFTGKVVFKCPSLVQSDRFYQRYSARPPLRIEKDLLKRQHILAHFHLVRWSFDSQAFSFLFRVFSLLYRSLNLLHILFWISVLNIASLKSIVASKLLMNYFPRMNWSDKSSFSTTRKLIHRKIPPYWMLVWVFCPT